MMVVLFILSHSINFNRLLRGKQKDDGLISLFLFDYMSVVHKYICFYQIRHILSIRILKYRKSMINSAIKLGLSLLMLFWLADCTEFYSNFSLNLNVECYGISKDANALYMSSTSHVIYRFNYTKVLGTQDFTYATSHTDTIKSIAISKEEKYFATGSDDHLIEVVNTSTRTKVCTLEHYNQVRSLVFDPNDIEVLYAGSVDDNLRKWNVTGCSLIAQKSIGYSIHTINIDSAGTKIIYGTLEGHVGFIDTSLTSATTSVSPHQFTVMDIFFTNSEYYASFGQDAVGILWKDGVIIDSYTATTRDKPVDCKLYATNSYNQSFSIASCIDDGYRSVFTFKITNTTIVKIASHGYRDAVTFSINKFFGVAEQYWTMFYSDGQVGMHSLSHNGDANCDDHFGEQTTLNVCLFCHLMMDGCHFCVNQTSCDTCSIGYYRSGGSCFKCPEGCSQCTSSNNCNKCGVGYQEQGNSNKCFIKNNNNEVGCFEYQNNNGKCQDAGNGYYLNNDRIKICSHAQTGCLECQASNGNCRTCETGYYVSSNSCNACSDTMSGCLACANSSVCLWCSVAFKDNGAFRQCSDCYETCATCSPYYDDCLTCYASQNRELDGTSCNCMAGYYSKIPTNFTCGLCSSVLNNCYLCNNNTVCIQCQPHFYFVTLAGRIQCQTCNQFCETCSINSDNCTTCNSITYNRELSGTTCICATGYVDLSGSVSCSSCSVLNDGCLACTTDTMCTSCDTGYYLKVIDASTELCEPCPYYCPDCGVNGTGDMVCLSCQAGSHRTLVSGVCECDTGYFDDNSTAVCEQCAAILSNCLECTNRRSCDVCGPGMLTDPSGTICASCWSTCLTCGTYFDECTTCDPSTNRVLSGTKCVCLAYAYEENGVCIRCDSAISNCNSCENPYFCTGCQSGFTLQEDLKACINCEAQINGCSTCTSSTNCTSCVSPFILINSLCRCPLDLFTSEEDWGKCQAYSIPGLESSLNVELEAHQHQNNSMTIFIRFRAEILYVLNQALKDSIALKINGKSFEITFDYVENNRIHIRTELEQEYADPIITVVFSADVFYNQNLLTLSDLQKSLSPRRLYQYSQAEIKATEPVKETLKYVFLIFKWVFFGMSIIGLGHVLQPFVVFFSLMPIFLMINMSLPSSLSCVLEGLLAFQWKSIVPLLEISSDTLVIFPPMTYDYYRFLDYFLIGKLGDLLTIVLVNVMTKFDQGIVRMFPPGRIRRYLYQSLVRRGYAVMSLCILSFQASFILLAGVYIKRSEWESMGQIFNYCSCVFVFGFYLTYNFNHASNLQNTKQVKNIENEHCFNGINPQDSAAPKTTLIVFICDFWIIGSLHLIGPMPYFCSSLLLLFIRTIVHLRPNFYIGKIQFTLRTLQHILLMGIFSVMFVFYLSENLIELSFATCRKLGITCSVFILLYVVFVIIQKAIFLLKLETDWVKSKPVKNGNGENQEVIFAQKVEEEDEAEADDVESTQSRKMNQFFGNSMKSKAELAGNFGNTMRKPTNQEAEMNENKSDMPNYSQLSLPQRDAGKFSRSLIPNMNKTGGPGEGRGTGDFFNNTLLKKQKEKEIRIKSANTSKYAQNHLQLRYRAQNILTKQPDEFEE